MHTVKIISFDPLQLELPEGTEFSGTIKIELPIIHVIVQEILDPSWGAIAENSPRLTAEMPGAGFEITQPENSSLTISELVEFITRAAGDFEKAHKIYQAKFDEHGALLKPMLG